MNTEIDYIPEPFLEFGYRQRMKDPKDGLFLFGPLEVRKPHQMRIGVIGTPKGIGIYRKWVEGLRGFIPAIRPDSPHHLAYPGFEAVFQTEWPQEPMVEIGVSATEVSNAVRKADRYKAIYEA